MPGRHSFNAQNERHDTIQELTVMYDKVLSKMKSPKVMSDIDLYTLYDCVSLILSFHLSNDKSFTTGNTNVLRLMYAITICNIEPTELFFLFFENDKLPKDNINLEGAMDTAEYSETEKKIFKRNLHYILTMTNPKKATSNENEDDEDHQTSSSGEDDLQISKNRSKRYQYISSPELSDNEETLVHKDEIKKTPKKS